MANMPPLRRGTRLPDAERKRLGAQLLREYDRGQSIRQLCAETGYSIGRVRRLLEEAGVIYRGRGGGRRAPAKE